MKSQNDAILHHLTHGGPLTPLDALRLFGCFRLGARCWDLKQRGVKIETRMVEVNGKRVAEYRIAA